MLGKLLNHLQPKRKDSTEDWPAFIGSTEKTSHCNASNCLFILNRCLSSCLKSVFSFCLLEFEPQDHQDVGKTSLNMYCLVSPRGGAPRSDTGNHQPPAPLLPPPVDADLPRRVGPGGLLTSEDLHEDQDATLKAGARPLQRNRMFLETSLDHSRRDWAWGEATGTNLRAYCVSGFYITQTLHPTNTESLWWWSPSMEGNWGASRKFDPQMSLTGGQQRFTHVAKQESGLSCGLASAWSQLSRGVWMAPPGGEAWSFAPSGLGWGRVDSQGRDSGDEHLDSERQGSGEAPQH